MTALLLTLAMLLTGATALAEAAFQTNTEKALALIDTFASGDSALAASLLDDGYIQHNSGIADGVSGLGEALTATAEQGISMTKPICC